MVIYFVGLLKEINKNPTLSNRIWFKKRSLKLDICYIFLDEDKTATHYISDKRFSKIKMKNFKKSYWIMMWQKKKKQGRDGDLVFKKIWKKICKRSSEKKLTPELDLC